MKFRFVYLLFAFCMFTFMSCSDDNSANTTEKEYVASGHPEWAPIMFKSGDKIDGAGAALVSKIFNELGVKINVQYQGHWDEVQTKAKDGSVDVIVAAYKTTEREAYMDYSIAYTNDPVAIFVKKGNAFPFESWTELISKKGVVTIGDSYGNAFDTFVKESLNVVEVSEVDSAFAKIIDGSADYFVYALYSGQNAIKNSNISNEVESLANYVSSEDFYITISKKSPLVKYLEQVNALITKYKGDGTIDSLINAYNSGK